MIDTTKIRIGSIFINRKKHECIIVNMMRHPDNEYYDTFFYVCIEEEDEDLSYLNNLQLNLYDIEADKLKKLKILRY